MKTKMKLKKFEQEVIDELEQQKINFWKAEAKKVLRAIASVKEELADRKRTLKGMEKKYKELLEQDTNNLKPNPDYSDTTVSGMKHFSDGGFFDVGFTNTGNKS